MNVDKLTYPGLIVNKFEVGRRMPKADQLWDEWMERKDHWIFESDREKCFDRINHEYLLNKLQTFPRMRRIIKGWLFTGGTTLPNRGRNATRGSSIPTAGK